MTTPSPPPSPRHNKAIVSASIAVSVGIAIVLLGTAGVVASLVFLPILASLAVQHVGINDGKVPTDIPDARKALNGMLSRFLGHVGHPTVAMIVELDDFQRLEEIHDQATLDRIRSFTQSVIEAHLTEEDLTVCLDGACFASALAPQAPHSLEVMLNTCTRIQSSLNSVQILSDVPVKLTASIGFSSSDKMERPTTDAILQGAFTALAEARRKGPGAVRSFSREMSVKRQETQKAGKEVAKAFERGEIHAYFQPQISLKSGRLEGFEALTRWNHPERGILSPRDFLHILEHANLMETLGETMTKEALNALNHWDEAGLDVPRVGVNFSTQELRDPFLVDRIAMLLDASGVASNRLVVEVLETVVATDPDDDIICNLAALAHLGCGVDLDDFGTGYASITNIRRFSVGRIKIDRSFVSGLDKDPEQREMVSAILTMTERLGVEALAEGVETIGEMETLRQLGCHNAQGFKIARPMPLEETVGWVQRHCETLNTPVVIQHRAG